MSTDTAGGVQETRLFQKVHFKDSDNKEDGETLLTLRKSKQDQQC